MEKEQVAIMSHPLINLNSLSFNRIGPIALFLMLCIVPVSFVLYLDFNDQSQWNDHFKLAMIPSSADDNVQKAYYHLANGDEPKPLIVSLHTWSGNYQQADPLAPMIQSLNWNYIRPDLRGANNHPGACLSPLVISDFDDAIYFMKEKSEINEVIVVGLSGGGYTALGLQQKTTHRLKHVIVWAAITDLASWYGEIKRKGADSETGYLKDIENCTESSSGDLNLAAAKSRSPLYLLQSKPLNGRLDMYAGINDGHNGSVSISHSLNYFNKLVSQSVGEGGHSAFYITKEVSHDLINKNMANLPRIPNAKIGERSTIFQQQHDNFSLTVFEGAHEMLHDYTANRVRLLYE